MPCDNRLRNLTVAHIVLGIVAVVAAPVRLPDLLGLAQILPPFGLERILIAPLFALVMGQAVLIALWVVAGGQSPWIRLAGLIAGTIFLEAILAVGLNGEFIGAGSVTIAVTTAALLLIRALGVRIARQAGEGHAQRHEPDGLRFSIRGLMTLTAAVALLSAGARAFQENNGRFLLMAAIWALCFVAVGLVALWATLGQARPRRRVPAMIVLSPVLGGFFASASKAHQAGQFYIFVTMILYPVVLLASLHVIRSCGYRLVGRAMPFPDEPSIEMETHEPSALV